jgi:hypothetical protein
MYVCLHSVKRRIIIRVFEAFVAKLSVLLLRSVSFAQTSVPSGSISGTVTDTTGAVVPIGYCLLREYSAKAKFERAQKVQESFQEDFDGLDLTNRE